MTLTVGRHVTSSELTLTILGVLDYATIGNFNESLGDLEGITSIVIDFGEMEFTDSTGIGAILDTIYAAHEYNVRVVFRGLRQDVEAVFETMGVFQILQALQGRV
jgi:anti-anti-sigma factor